MTLKFAFDLKITGKQLSDMPKQVQEKVIPSAMQRLSNITYYEMRARAPVRTGALRTSIVQRTHKTARFTSIEVGPTIAHTPFAVLPTRAHVIRPREKPVLHWVTDEGEDVFAMRVFHPGTRGNTFIQDTADAVNKQVVDVFERVYIEEIERY